MDFVLVDFKVDATIRHRKQKTNNPGPVIYSVLGTTVCTLMSECIICTLAHSTVSECITIRGTAVTSS